MSPDVESRLPEGIQRLSQKEEKVGRLRCGDFVGVVGTEAVVVEQPGGVENPDEQVGEPCFEGLRDALEETALKEDEQKEEADAFDAEEIFGGEDAEQL